ncbi:AAA family ATPase [Breznakiella homolactica]|uniref:AAA family ATPase n=1 Tax=Breznakiella homolactica TaxID=2798577 RepID=A0A7T8B8T7_9SPIR|nr:AAA family ATPase [Breznakiella homolactica]QQO07656.1 AAA family ATPase [Breznakiella homolactica]
MELNGFSVSEFRSIKYSNWIEADKVTALIGTNESGKTNILVPLWKFNPASEGEIDQILDFPRSKYNEFRSLKEKPKFIKVKFILNESESKKISELTNMDYTKFNELICEMDYDLNRSISFPLSKIDRSTDKLKILELLKNTLSSIENTEASKQEESMRDEINKLLNEIINIINSDDKKYIMRADLRIYYDKLGKISLEKAVKTSLIKPLFEKLLEDIYSILFELNKQNPEDIKEVKDFIFSHLPSFVYYSNYGNLDSEIYLPHVIANLKRTDLGPKEAAKARTLKVLFEFVRLSPEEIHELGKEIINGRPPQNQSEIDEIAKRKKERDILLQSASTELTQKFRDWWKQGEYRFRFQADGDHFRIWVSDDNRPEDIELEGRSTGLQWFLSFFLVFLVESKKSHLNSILLLDEPGLSLHPLAQKDLALFFENLAKTNQLLYTTHSPFLIDTDKLDRVRSVYINDDGYTEVSPDLRASQNKTQQQRSIFPVHAALGLSVSDTLLLGCIPIIIEGQSDQNYLTIIKNLLINHKKINPMKEIVFLPAGGVKGIKALLPIITGTSEELPFVIVDSDGPGLKQYKDLIEGIYNSENEKVIQIGSLTTIQNAEVEDLFPHKLLADTFDKSFRAFDVYASDLINNDEAIINQLEKFAQSQNIHLETPGWKVVLSKNVKSRILNKPDLIDPNTEFFSKWIELFSKIVE